MPLRPSASDVTETIKNAAQANGSVAQSIRAASGGIVKASRSSAISARPVSAIGAVVKSSAIARSIGLAPAISSGGGPPPVGSVSAHTGAKTLMTLSTINYDLYTFLNTGNNTFVVDSGSITADIFVLGGGGSGGTSYGGGGGAGGFSVTSNVTFAPGTYSIVVGAGGAGVSSANTTGNNGGNSTVTVNGVTYTGFGGGGGGGYNLQGRNGGCGGGGNTPARIRDVGGGIGSQGFNGGGSGDYGSGGGGGGMGSAGLPTLHGGNGKADNFTGTSVVYAGGGGAVADGQFSGSGGSGGGGTGNGSAGTDGLGGGGGASAGTSGRGGHGRVMIRVRR